MERSKRSRTKAGSKASYLEAALQASQEAVLVLDAEARVVWLNHALEELLALPHSDWAGQPLKAVLRILDEETRQTEALESRLRDAEWLSALGQRALAVRHDGREFPFELRCVPSHEPEGWLLFVRDVFQTRLLAETVSFQRSHDALTGLLNRAEFERVLQGAVDDASTNRHSHALCYLDRDQFKVINNTCGHVAGDELLRQITELIRLQLRAGDTVARLGADEFGILLWDVDQEVARTRAEELVRIVHDDLFVWGNKVFSLASCAGLVLIEQDCDNWAAVLRHAEIACNHAKQSGGNRVALYSADDRELTRQTTEMEWVSTIVQALQTDRFVLHGQPIVPLADAGGVEHVEILLRMDAMITSMTPKERSKPELINAKRKIRIAKGSGTSVQEVNKLLKMHLEMQTAMKKIKKMGGLKGMMAMLGKGGMSGLGNALGGQDLGDMLGKAAPGGLQGLPGGAGGMPGLPGPPGFKFKK